MLILLLACAADAPEVTLTWHQDTVPCSDSTAVWELPDPAPVAAYTFYDSTDGNRYYETMGAVVGGSTTFACFQGDVTVTYAVVEAGG